MYLLIIGSIWNNKKAEMAIVAPKIKFVETHVIPFSGIALFGCISMRIPLEFLAEVGVSR